MKVRPGKKLGLTITIKNGVGAEIIAIDRASCCIVGNISVGDIIVSIGRAGVGAKLSERRITSKADFAVDTDQWRRIVMVRKKKPGRVCSLCTQYGGMNASTCPPGRGQNINCMHFEKSGIPKRSVGL